MVRLYLPFFLALFILVVPKESEGQYGKLAELTEVRIVVENLKEAKEKLGLTSKDVENHVLVLLRSKLPGLEVSRSLSSLLYININLGLATSHGKPFGYFGAIDVEVRREVIIIGTKKTIMATATGIGTTRQNKPGCYTSSPLEIVVPGANAGEGFAYISAC